MAGKPILAITMGDPSGVGPEIVVKALLSPRLWKVCRPLVVGRLPAMEAAAGALGARVGFRLAGSRLPSFSQERCPLVETGPERDPLPQPGRASAAGGLST